MIIMTNGEKFFLLTSSFLLGCLLAKNTSKKNVYINSPTINQYLNRLKEFFDIDNIDEIEDEFLNLIDFGINPGAAFDAVTLDRGFN